MDFITDLPEVHGYDSILTIVDHDLTKGIILLPCKKSINALETAALLLDNLIKRFGIPSRIISDRGPQFASQVFRAITDHLGIQQLLSSAFHPQTDGQSERANQEVETYLRIYCSHQPENWLGYLPIIEFVHNSTPRDATKQTPFFLMMGYEPRDLPSDLPHAKHASVLDRLNGLKQAREDAKEALTLAARHMEERTRRKFTPFKVGDLVKLSTRNTHTHQIPSKFRSKFDGPFQVLEKRSDFVYKIELPPQWKRHPVFHISELHPFEVNDVHGPSFPRPPPETIDGEEQYEVDSIVRHKGKGKWLRFLIHWKGYEDSQYSWEPITSLDNASDLLLGYLRTHSNVILPPSHKSLLHPN